MKAVLVGSTGMIGSYLLGELLNDGYFEKVITLTRKPLQVNNSRHSNVVVNFDDYGSLQNAFDKDVVIFSTIGTTQKNVGGDKAAYRKIDFDIPVNIARIAAEKGVQTFVLVSSVGANAGSGSFYIKLKGEIENTIADLRIDNVYFMRPSFLLGDRKEYRISEKIVKVIMAPLSAMFFGGMRKFKSIHAKDLSLAILKVAKANKPGRHILHYDDIIKIAQS